MKQYIKTFMEYYDIAPGELIPCIACSNYHEQPPHHIVYRSQGGTDDISNLAGLCFDCHELTHKGTIKAATLQKLIDERINNEQAENN